MSTTKHMTESLEFNRITPPFDLSNPGLGNCGGGSHLASRANRSQRTQQELIVSKFSYYYRFKFSEKTRSHDGRKRLVDILIIRVTNGISSIFHVNNSA
jgi:hypothetical protein